MARLISLLALGTLVALVASSPAYAQDTVVVARVVEAAGPWMGCGRAAVRAEVLFETVTVEGAAFPHARFVGVYDCPGARRVQGTLRLTLRAWTRPGRSVSGPRPDQALPRFVVGVEELVSAARLEPLLGLRRVALRSQYPGSRTEGEWTYFGERLSVRFEDGRVVEVRASVPASAGSCAAVATWAGYPDAGPALRRREGCQWPGLSDRHRLAPGRIARVEGGVFRVVVSRAR